MTEIELIKYYRENRNKMDEITLTGVTSRIDYRFRHYTELFTGEDKWVRISDGSLYNTEGLLKCFIKPFEFKAFEGLKVGDVILTVNSEHETEYFKKIDNDAFIECDEKGHIEITEYLKRYFLYTTEEITEEADIVKKI